MSVQISVESLSGCAWNGCPSQRGIRIDLTLRSNMGVEEALLTAKQLDEARQASGFDQAALDDAARQGFGNGAYEDSEEDGGAVIEEFYTATETLSRTNEPSSSSSRTERSSLSNKLEAQALKQLSDNAETP